MKFLDEKNLGVASLIVTNKTSSDRNTNKLKIKILHSYLAFAVNVEWSIAEFFSGETHELVSFIRDPKKKLQMDTKLEENWNSLKTWNNTFHFDLVARTQRLYVLYALS